VFRAVAGGASVETHHALAAFAPGRLQSHEVEPGRGALAATEPTVPRPGVPPGREPARVRGHEPPARVEHLQPGVAAGREGAIVARDAAGFGDGRPSHSTAAPPSTPAAGSAMVKAVAFESLATLPAASAAVTRTQASLEAGAGTTQSRLPEFGRPEATGSHGPDGPLTEYSSVTVATPALSDAVHVIACVSPKFHVSPPAGEVRATAGAATSAKPAV
jgi:hypothetical protein